MNAYQHQTLPELSLAAFALCRCEHCNSLTHNDDIDIRDDGAHCMDCRDEQWSEGMAQFGWMRSHVQRATAARRAGDEETYEAIKHDVLRHDSPLDPMNRRGA